MAWQKTNLELLTVDQVAHRPGQLPDGNTPSKSFWTGLELSAIHTDDAVFVTELGDALFVLGVECLVDCSLGLFRLEAKCGHAIAMQRGHHLVHHYRH
jgi:hypothetical protein